MMSLLHALPRRLRAISIHVLASGVIAALASVLVFFIWYPHPYGEMTGSLQLFVLLTGVDLVLGPMLTGVVAAPGKPLRELARDVALIACVQLAAFGYGIYTIALARPAVIAFEVDRLRVVTAVEIETESLANAPPELRRLSWTGPVLLAARKPTDPDQAFRAMSKGLGGVDLSMDPANWSDIAGARAEMLKAARPVSDLLRQYPEASPQVEAIAVRARIDRSRLRFLPLMSRRASWVALVREPDAQIVGHLPLEGFF